MPTVAYKALYELAEDQKGYFTALQAAHAGVRPMALIMMERRGDLERASRGVYRLMNFPVDRYAQYMEATLWPYEVTGVLSHETALSLYEMSDIDPPKVHITVPKYFRIQRRIPAYLKIHRAELSPEDLTRFEGMPITTPERTIRDCAATQLGPALLQQAIRDGVASARLQPHQAARLHAQLVAISESAHLRNPRLKRRPTRAR